MQKKPKPAPSDVTPVPLQYTLQGSPTRISPMREHPPSAPPRAAYWALCGYWALETNVRKEIHAEFYSRSINSRALNGQEPPENSTGREDRYQGENSKSSDTMRTLARSSALTSPAPKEWRQNQSAHTGEGRPERPLQAQPPHQRRRPSEGLTAVLLPWHPLGARKHSKEHRHAFSQNTCQIQQVLKKIHKPHLKSTLTLTFKHWQTNFYYR